MHGQGTFVAMCGQEHARASTRVSSWGGCTRRAVRAQRGCKHSGRGHSHVSVRPCACADADARDVCAHRRLRTGGACVCTRHAGIAPHLGAGQGAERCRGGPCPPRHHLITPPPRSAPAPQRRQRLERRRPQPAPAPGRPLRRQPRHARRRHGALGRRAALAHHPSGVAGQEPAAGVSDVGGGHSPAALPVLSVSPFFLPRRCCAFFPL